VRATREIGDFTLLRIVLGAAEYAPFMAGSGRTGVRLGTQVLVLQVVVVVLTLGIAFGLFAFLSSKRLTAEYSSRALAIANSVASEPAVRAEVAQYDAISLTPSPSLTAELAAGEAQRIGAEAQHRTGALFVVITDDRGIRLAHPTHDLLGQRVGTDPSEALAGREVMLEESGSLGQWVGAKVPVLRPNSNDVGGEVSVGISTSAVHRQLMSDLRTAAAIVGVALLLGIVSSVLLARRWRGLTLGLEPAEMAELVRTQAAVLHGIGEGVLAADTSWKTTFVNDEACRLLEIAGKPGRPVDEMGLTPRVLDVFKSADATPTLATVGERIVVVSSRSVTRDGRDLGTVLVVRDRTDIELLTRQLDAVQSMSAVLRAQRHEFANRLHLLSGLLQSDCIDEAQQYLDELLGSGPLGSALPGIDAVRDPYLQAFIAAKAAAAREAGVTLRLGENTSVSGRLVLPVDVTTVLGNLIDNAMDAARLGEADKQVEVELVQDHSTLHVVVADSGDGVAADVVDHLFTEGVSTKPGDEIPGGRGVGLALSRQIGRALGGEVRLSSAGNPDAELRGAEFIAQLPGVMMEEEPQWAAQS
jgi:two-component system, CitB family, sensor kinase